MQTRAPARSSIAIMAVFALSCFGLLLFLWVSFGGPTPLKAKSYRVDVLVGEATQLADQADVRIAGVPVGKVVKLDRDGVRTRATLEIKPKYAPLHDDVRAVLRQKTLLGETYLELTPGSRTAPRIPEGGTLPRRAVASTVELDEILQSLDRPSRKNLQDFLKGLAASTDGRAQDINDALGVLPTALQDGGDVLETAAADRRAVAQLVRDAGTVFATIGRRDQATREVITAGNQVLQTTAAQSKDLQATIKALPGVLEALKRESPSTIPVAQQLAPALRALQPVARTLEPTVRRAGALGTQLSAVSQDLKPVITAARTGLPAARRIARTAGPLFDAVSPFAADLVPVANFLDAYKVDFTRSWAQAAAATNATAATASGKQAHYLRLTLPLWTEVLAVNQRRSPTNRANPYPKPGGLEELAAGRESYGCANTSNPVVIPDGPSPACKAATAVTVGGKTQLFPNLTPAP